MTTPLHTLSDFLPLVGSGFGLVGSDPIVSLILVEAVPLSDQPYPDQLREPFSLQFRLAPNWFLAQGTYEMRHETLGDVAMFVVPISQDADGTLYEAAFN